MKEAKKPVTHIQKPVSETKPVEQSKYTLVQEIALTKAQKALEDIGAENFSLDIKGRELEMKCGNAWEGELHKYTIVLRGTFLLKREAVEIFYLHGGYSVYSTL